MQRYARRLAGYRKRLDWGLHRLLTGVHTWFHLRLQYENKIAIKEEKEEGKKRRKEKRKKERKKKTEWALSVYHSFPSWLWSFVSTEHGTENKNKNEPTKSHPHQKWIFRIGRLIDHVESAHFHQLHSIFTWKKSTESRPWSEKRYIVSSVNGRPSDGDREKNKTAKKRIGKIEIK